MKLRYILLFMLAGGLKSSNAQMVKDTFSVYFLVDDYALSKRAEDYLKGVFYKILPSEKIIYVLGYADTTGSKSYNFDLSQKRADEVKKWLIVNGIEPDFITLCLGKGEFRNVGLGTERDRKVDIIVSRTSKKPVEKYFNELDTGDKFILTDIFFYPNKHSLIPESYKALDDLLRVLKVNKNIVIEIQGHVCCISTEAKDAFDSDVPAVVLVDTIRKKSHFGRRSLSLNRARVIYDYLIENGVDSMQLRYRGFGRTKPLILHETSAEDRALNRRVEIKILKK